MHNIQLIDDLIDTSYRKTILRITLTFAFLTLAYFTYINFMQYGFIRLAKVEAFLSIVSLLVVLYLPKVHNKSITLLWLLRGCVFVTALLVCYMATAKLQHSIQLWIIEIPLISYIMLGKKWGFGVTLSSILTIFVIICVKFSDQFYLIQPSPLSNLIAVLSIVWLITHIYEDKTHKAQRTIAKLAVTDSLTALLNRSVLEIVFQKHQKYGLSIILIDIDFFKSINDTYGHERGDAVLVHFAKRLTVFFQENGYVFRIGGEEFCVILPKYDLTTAVKTANIFQKSMNEHPFIINENDEKCDAQPTIKMTFSGGVSTTEPQSTLDNMLSIADKSLYIAKNNGRNKIVSSLS